MSGCELARCRSPDVRWGVSGRSSCDDLAHVVFQCARHRLRSLSRASSPPVCQGPRPGMWSGCSIPPASYTCLRFAYLYKQYQYSDAHQTVYRNVGRVRNMKSCKTNPQLIATIDKLKAKTRETEAAIWRDIALRLEKPKRNWAEANLRVRTGWGDDRRPRESPRRRQHKQEDHGRRVRLL